LRTHKPSATVGVMRVLGALSVAAIAVLASALFVNATLTPPAPAAPVPVAASPTPSPSPAAVAPASSPPAIALDRLRISLPRLGIDLPLALGDVQRDVVLGRTPEDVALLFPTTNVPGTGGNSYIYAHARNAMFLELWNVKLGDRVRISGPGDTHFDYVITRIAPRVDPADTTWLDPTGAERITLQTSTGPTSAYPRFIAVAERVAQD
jgi:LPXTG-site transpeptidase (sortase) family protein